MHKIYITIAAILVFSGCMPQNLQQNNNSAIYQQQQAVAMSEDCGVASLDCFEESPVDNQPIVETQQPAPTFDQNTPRSTDQGKYYGIPIREEQKHIVFVLDISGSMENLNEGVESAVTGLAIGALGKLSGRSELGGLLGSMASSHLRKRATKLGGAKRELNSTINSLGVNTRFNIITFGGSNTSVWRSDLITANSSNKNQATRYVNQLSAGGGTPALSALRRAFQFSDVDTIFFVSDGLPTDSNAQGIVGEIQRINQSREVKINTVGLGGDQDADFMTRLAADNRGRYVKR